MEVAAKGWEQLAEELEHRLTRNTGRQQDFSRVRQVQQFGHGGLGGVGGEPPVSVAAVAARRVDHLQRLKVEFGNR